MIQQGHVTIHFEAGTILIHLKAKPTHLHRLVAPQSNFIFFRKSRNLRNFKMPQLFFLTFLNAFLWSIYAKSHDESNAICFSVAQGCAYTFITDFLEILGKIRFLTRDQGSKNFFDAIFWKSIQNCLGTTSFDVGIPTEKKSWFCTWASLDMLHFSKSLGS